jgi:hypothetical protein
MLNITFGDGGKVVTQIRNSNAHATDVAIQTDGKIIVAWWVVLSPFR